MSKQEFDSQISREPEQLLRQGLETLGFSAHHAPRLLCYLDVLAKWNGAYNITAIRDPASMVVLHVLDSLAVLPHIEGERIVDVGTGGGLPGMVFAIVRPDWDLTLLDSNHKKTRFLRRAVRELKLENVRIETARVEKFQPECLYDVVISRAFARVDRFLRAAGHLCADKGRIVAMKGPREECRNISEDCPFVLEKAVSLRVPFLDAGRQLLIYQYR